MSIKRRIATETSVRGLKDLRRKVKKMELPQHETNELIDLIEQRKVAIKDWIRRNPQWRPPSK